MRIGHGDSQLTKIRIGTNSWTHLWYIIMIYIYIYIFIYLGWTPMRAVTGSASSCSPDSPDSPKTPWPRTHKFQFHKLGNGGEALRWYTGCRCSSHHRFLYKSPGAQTGRWYEMEVFQHSLGNRNGECGWTNHFRLRLDRFFLGICILRIGVQNVLKHRMK